MKVDFMIIGAQKAATTSLYSILDSHPSLVGSRPKEPHFFSKSKNWREELSQYEQRFIQQEGALYFEASTTYTFFPLTNWHIWDDLYEYNPELKFIYLVRDPVQRIISSYMHSYERGITDLSIEEVIVQNRKYIDVSRYATQITPYIERFGREYVLIIDFDDFNDNRDKAMRSIAAFLSVDFAGFKDYEKTRSNVSLGGNKKHRRWDKPNLAQKAVRKYLPGVWDQLTRNEDRAFHQRPTLSVATQRMILQMLRLEIDALEKIMNKDLSHWRQIHDRSI
ncbi:sulfotransferase family protein [Tunicatimonas pelagia]|uniref:sulfotransferase family protein n=1 Tax=Tunicatimonas pelagia TaxID=931531 RepID=UPI002664EB83|nr:sulfotransferase [Tunicatimonas pelagia]WKN41791.1 sulfotransferase [Tunicatimonas pelagia]